MTKLTNPTPLFLNARGSLLDAGFIYVGVASADPEDQPIQLYWDFERTIPAAQPLRTSGGRIVNGATPAFVFMAETDYSMRVRDADGNLISYVPTLFPEVEAFQPLDADLTAIAALTTTSFGRNLLTLANAGALKTATGIPDPLPAAGGIVTGNITRQSAGSHLYYVNSTYVSGRVYGPENTTDPTSQPGDIWLKAAS
jgi:hypothetical protein